MPPDAEPPDTKQAAQKNRTAGEARRAQIIEAAADVIADTGYARTSLARIADKAGISKGVITYHFSTKDEILRLVATGFFDRAWQYMEPRIFAEPSAIGQLRSWIGSQLEYFGAHRTEFLAMSEVVENHRTDDGSYAFATETAEEVAGLTDILTAGQQAGEIRDFDTRIVANIILSSTDGVMAAWAMNPKVDLPAHTTVLLEFIEHAIRKQPS